MPPYRDPVERFVEKISVDPESGCWPWTAPLDRCGYGRIQIGNRSTLAHRFAYELLVGPIPDGLQLDHLCRVRNCMNPDHLEPVTGAENTRRGAIAQTHCKRGHEFTPENTYYRQYSVDISHRQCRACNRIAAARYREASLT